jgi:hypothetical protein
VILPQITIARGHWVLGALFLVIILEEYVPRVDSDGRAVRSTSLIIPWALMVGAVGVWVTVVVADIVHDILIHFLWGDILFAAGALELARRKGVYKRAWLNGVLPAAYVSCGALFLIHVRLDPSGQGASWHMAMGLMLIAGGLLEFARLGLRRAPLISPAVLPLSAFALALIAIPVAAAS